jgi:hypothetical protein
LKSSQEAIELLRQQIKEIDLLEDSTVYSAEHTKWLTDTLYLLEEIFGKNSRIYTAFATMSWKPSGTYVAPPSNINAEVERLKMQAYKAGLDIARGLLESLSVRLAMASPFSYSSDFILASLFLDSSTTCSICF